MRVGISCHASFGGSGVIATELGLALAAHGHEVHFICAHAPPRLGSTLPPRVTLHQVSTPEHPLLPHGDFTLALASKLAEVGSSLDVLHVHYALPLATSALLARELLGARAPRLVTTVHGTDVLTLGLQPEFRPLVRQALQRSDLVTAPSAFLARAAIEGLPLDRKVEVVSNFVDTGRFAPKAHPSTSVLTHASNFRRLKRVQDVVSIFARVRQQVPCTLRLIGDGPERPAAEARLRDLGLWSHVELLGEVVDVVPPLQSSDVFLLPSEVESFGLAALEAMSCGVPVVASATGGLPEVVRDGETGFLHHPGDVEAMATSVVSLLKDRTRHEAMSHAARAWCTEHWQPGPIVSKWEALYGALLEPS